MAVLKFAIQAVFILAVAFTAGLAWGAFRAGAVIMERILVP